MLAQVVSIQPRVPQAPVDHGAMQTKAHNVVFIPHITARVVYGPSVHVNQNGRLALALVPIFIKV